MRFKIFQVMEDHPLFGEVAFRDLDKIGGRVDLRMYRQTYASMLEAESDQAALEMIFKQFNVDLPKDYYGRSLSVSDIVLLDACRSYRCESVGWHRLTAEQTDGSVL
jgi:YodL-like protein